MQIKKEGLERRNELIAKLDFLGDLQKMVNIKTVNIDKDILFMPSIKITKKLRQEFVKEAQIEESAPNELTQGVYDILLSKRDGEDIIDELMKMKEKGVEFTRRDAKEILGYSLIKEFIKQQEKIRETFIKTRVTKAMYRENLDEAAQIIVELIKRADDNGSKIIARTIKDLNAGIKLKRKIMDYLSKEERLKRRILFGWNNNLFRDLRATGVTDGKNVIPNAFKGDKIRTLNTLKILEQYMPGGIKEDKEQQRDDLDIQEGINILHDSGIEALITYLKENDMDERDFYIGNVQEVSESLSKLELIKYVDFINKLERISLGEIQDKSQLQDIEDVSSYENMDVSKVYQEVNDKYRITKDMAKALLNLPQIRDFANEYVQFRDNLDKIKIRAMLEAVNDGEESKVFINLIDYEGTIKLESVLKAMERDIDDLNNISIMERIYNMAEERCGMLILKRREILKDLVEFMNRDILTKGKEKRLDTKDIDDLFDSNDDKIEEKILVNLKQCERQGLIQAKEAIYEIKYIERLGELLEKIEINIDIEKIKEAVKDLQREDDKDKIADGVANLILESNGDEKKERAMLFELLAVELDTELKKKIDTKISAYKDEKKITVKQYFEWIKNINKVYQVQKTNLIEY